MEREREGTEDTMEEERMWTTKLTGLVMDNLDVKGIDTMIEVYEGEREPWKHERWRQ